MYVLYNRPDKVQIYIFLMNVTKHEKKFFFWKSSRAFDLSISHYAIRKKKIEQIFIKIPIIDNRSSLENATVLSPMLYLQNE